MAQRVFIADADTLKRALAHCEIPFETWGEGPTKTPKQLMREIRDGETQLIIWQQQLWRYVRQSQACIFSDARGMLERLYEVKQVFANGAERVRDPKISVSEKLKRGESRFEGIIRGIQEELTLPSFTGEGLEYLGTTTKRKSDSKSYPGLPSLHRRYHFRWHMPHEFRRATYEEHQRGKVTYFGWKLQEAA